MKHTSGVFPGAGALVLPYHSWAPEREARAVLTIVHGFGEHSGRYTHVAEAIAAQGFAVHAFDLRGHGAAPGRRGHITAWSEFRVDVGAFLETIRQGPPLPLFLMGHSLGGLIALEYALRHPRGLAGVIASAPVLGQVGVSPLRLRLGRILSLVYPTFSLDAGLDLTALSRDPAVVQAYRDDRLVHGRGTARLATEVGQAVAWTQAHAPDLRVPLLILHGTADRIAAPEASRLFYERAGVEDRERREYAGGYHEPHNDLESERVLADLTGWIERHLPPSGTP